MTLRELVNEYGANGVIRIDAGNGCGGPTWVDWDKDADRDLGDIDMIEHKSSDAAYEEDGHSETLMEAAEMANPGYESDTIFASSWIERDEEGASNPYRIRVLF
jgi:hypothetical protein